MALINRSPFNTANTYYVLHGDLGESYQQHRPVAAIIAEQIGPTIVLAIAALLMAWVIAILTTLLIAGRDNIWSKLLSGAQIFLATAPPYWLATTMPVVFAVNLRIFPVVGESSPMGLVLPTFALALELSGFFGQVVLNEFTRVLEQPFVTSARTRGMSDFGVRLHHQTTPQDNRNVAQAHVLALLEETKKRGKALILISHDLAVVSRVADEILVMQRGEVISYLFISHDLSCCSSYQRSRHSYAPGENRRWWPH
ncbi:MULTISPECIES: ABC transporter permease [unclassified Bradyrhizobium]|uniref:ABC transporter permease n=2 Tax=Bradyrhizobium TaxID=374 RepID=UPI001CD3648E|nr:MULTISPECIES: ABC transporter permease [unclassified Bradyrhizobium]